MPKIVDHDKKREDIALKAASIFLEHGYKDLGMRQLCSHLSMSKSAVYHYFKSKDEIFKAATEAMMGHDGLTLKDSPLVDNASIQERLENFYKIFTILSPRHFQETKLVMEYIDVIGLEAVPDDICMKMASDNYETLLAKYVQSSNEEQIYSLLLGLLNHQLVRGEIFSFEYVSDLVRKHLT